MAEAWFWKCCLSHVANSLVLFQHKLKADTRVFEHFGYTVDENIFLSRQLIQPVYLGGRILIFLWWVAF
jgi:hypothetical protein